MSVDPRFILRLDGRAGRSLEGLEPASSYLDETAMRCRASAGAIRRKPEVAAEQVDQLLFGEDFDVLEIAGGWAFGKARRDGYVGFVEGAQLAPRGAAQTHRVAAISTYAFAEPNIRATPSGPLSLGSLVAAGEAEGGYVRVEGGGWIPARHLAPIGAFETDFVDVAERFLGAPYVWGGRQSVGLDCSALVQQALAACGRALPRDTDLQAKTGRAVGLAELQRGDLVFWRGHVAIMVNDTDIVHANGNRMAVTVEPLAEAIARTRANGGGEPTAYRRL